VYLIIGFGENDKDKSQTHPSDVFKLKTYHSFD